jgi:hypothetical protein
MGVTTNEEEKKMRSKSMIETLVKQQITISRRLLLIKMHDWLRNKSIEIICLNSNKIFSRKKEKNDDIIQRIKIR